jgi:hypothetical protein
MFPRFMIENIIYSAAESITPLTHGQDRVRKHEEEDEKMKTQSNYS